MLEPIRNNILFVFEDNVRSDGMFGEETESGIIYKTHNDSAGAPRWGTVLAVGPDVTEIENGDRILIEPLMWTEGFVHDGVKIWQTNDEKVMALG